MNTPPIGNNNNVALCTCFHFLSFGDGVLMGETLLLFQVKKTTKKTLQNHLKPWYIFSSSFHFLWPVANCHDQFEKAIVCIVNKLGKPIFYVLIIYIFVCYLFFPRFDLLSHGVSSSLNYFYLFKIYYKER